MKLTVKFVIRSLKLCNFKRAPYLVSKNISFFFSFELSFFLSNILWTFFFVFLIDFVLKYVFNLVKHTYE
jgi:hypothetical protein